MSSSARKAGVFVKQLSEQKLDPWCLICGINLRVDGRTFVVLNQEENQDLCETFSRVLGAEVREEYASINVCNRCERQLRRIGRYNSIILARREGKQMREQLDKNLANYGQTVVESQAGNESPESDIQSHETSIPSNPRRTSYSGTNTRDRQNYASTRSFSLSSTDSFGKSDKQKNLSFWEASELRCEERRRRISIASNSSEDSIHLKPSILAKRGSLDSNSSVSSLQHRSAAFREAYLGKTELHKGERAENVKRVKFKTKGKFSSFDETMASTDDKKKLVERSESLDTPNPKSKKRSKKNLKTSRSVDETKKETTGEKDTSPWAGRINPFDVQTKTKVIGDFGYEEHVNDDVFSEGIIDLEPKDGTTKNISEQEQDKLTDTSNKDSVGKDLNEEGSTQHEKRGSISEIEETINLKTQFKGFYYNIGSTEDLLKEFADEKSAAKATMKDSDRTESIEQNDDEIIPQHGDEDGGTVREPKKDGAEKDSEKLLNSHALLDGGEDEENIKLSDFPKPPKRTKKKNRRKSQESSKDESTLECDITEPIEAVEPEPTQEDDVTKTNGVKAKEAPKRPPPITKVDKTQVSVTESEEPETPEAPELKGEPGLTTPKSEKSPLIGKDGVEQPLKVNDGEPRSKAANPMRDFICCNIL